MELVDETGREWRDDLLTTATERFGRMLADETAKLRVEVATGIGKVRAEIADVRVDVAAEFARVRGDIAAVRTDVAGEIGKLRVDMANWRADLLKWSFLFWIGQVAAIAGLMAFMLRYVGR